MVEVEQDASEDFLRSMTHGGSGGGGVGRDREGARGQPGETARAHTRPPRPQIQPLTKY